MQYSSGTEIGKAAFDIAMRLSALSVLILTAFTSGDAQQAKFDKLASEGNLAFTAGRFAAAERAYLEALEEETKEKQASASSRLVILNALATIPLTCKVDTQRPSPYVNGHEPSPKQHLVDLPRPWLISSVQWRPSSYTSATTEERSGAYDTQSQFANGLLLGIMRRSLSKLTLQLLGVVLCGQGKCKQADQVVKRALRLCEPGNASCQVGLAAALTTLGAINVSRRRYSEAEDRYRAAIETLAAGLRPFQCHACSGPCGTCVALCE